VSTFIGESETPPILQPLAMHPLKKVSFIAEQIMNTSVAKQPKLQPASINNLLCLIRF
jgi:hypothetical protein